MKLTQSSVKHVKVHGEIQRPTLSNVESIKSMGGITEAANAIPGGRAPAMAEMKVEGLDSTVCTKSFAHGAFNDFCGSGAMADMVQASRGMPQHVQPHLRAAKKIVRADLHART